MASRAPFSPDTGSADLLSTPAPTPVSAVGPAPGGAEPAVSASTAVFPGTALASGMGGGFGTSSAPVAANDSAALPGGGGTSGGGAETASAAASASTSPADAAPVEASGEVPAICTEVESASSDSAAMQILASSQPTGLFSAYAEAGAAATEELVGARQSLIDNPPSLEAPSGISAETEAGTAAAATVSSAPAASAPGIDEIDGGGVCPAEPDTEHDPATAPIDEAPRGAAVVGGAPEDPVARAQYFEQQLSFAPVADDFVDTDPGPPPLVSLTEEADPGRLGELESTQAVSVDAELAAAGADMCVDEGVDAIYPSLPDEMLSASFDPGTSSLAGGDGFEHPGLSGEMEAAIDSGGAGGWAGQMAGLESNYATGAAARSRDEASARSDADAEIAALCDETIAEQRGYRTAAGEGVAGARETWRGELDAAQLTYDGERGRIRTDMVSGIERERLAAETAAAGHLEDGRREAEAERLATERRAQEERAAAQREADESDGFFDWIESKVSSFFDALRSLLHDLFDALRSLVRTIIEGAKWLANQAIELGRRAIVGLIHLAGDLLEAACDVFLAAFPEARDRAKAAIRGLVDTAEQGVNSAAEWLREQTNRVLDALGDALVAILDAYEAIYTFILNVVQFLVIGLVEVYRFMARLTIAAYNSPDQFEGQIYEELIGSDLTQPLPFELTEAEAAQLASGSGDGGAGMADLAALGADLGGGDSARMLTAPRLADGDIVMDQVLSLDADPALWSSLALSEGGSVEFGESNDPEATLAALRADLMGGGVSTGEEGAAPDGGVPSEPGAGVTAAPRSTEDQLQALMAQEPDCACDAEAPTGPTGPAIPLSAKIGPLTKGQRARYMMSQMWKGVKRWFSCNWGKILAGVIIALVVIAAIVAAVVLSGGTVAGLLAAAGAVIAPLMEVIAGAMIVYAIGRAMSYLGDYLSHAWNNRIVDSAKSLARAVAVGVVELIFAIITYVTAGAFRVLASAAKGTARVAASAARGVAKVARGTARVVGEGLEGAARVGGRVLRAGERAFVRVAGRTGRVMLVEGKLMLRNLRQGFARGVRTLRELGERLLGKLRFRRFRIVRNGRWFLLQGYINPWVTIAETDVSVWVDTVDENLTKSGRTPRSGDRVRISSADGTEFEGTVFGGTKTAPDYRDLARIGGLSPDANVIHHAVEQQVLERFPRAFTRAEINSLSRLRAIPRGVFNSRVHLSRIRLMWNEMYEALERRALTALQQRSAIMQYMNRVDGFINHMNAFQAANPAYRAAVSSGDRALMETLLNTEIDAFLATTANPRNAIPGIMASL